MRTFVTGGSGFVGNELIAALSTRGDEVRALARSDEAARRVTKAGATAVRGDLEGEDVLRAAMEGCDTVFHAAARVGVWGKREDFERDTVLGTRHMLAAARAAKIRRFVHVSTEAVLVGGPPLVDADETWPLPARPLGLYPWSKGIAETDVRSAAKDGLHTVVVRPRAIWGAGDTVLLPRLCEMVDAGKFMWVGGGHALTSTCHVKNVVAGMLAAASRGGEGEVYFLTDGDDLAYRDYFGGMLRARGRDISKF
jgi:nucleoside-diphosphate-sugar epimerase